MPVLSSLSQYWEWLGGLFGLGLPSWSRVGLPNVAACTTSWTCSGSWACVDKLVSLISHVQPCVKVFWSPWTVKGMALGSMESGMHYKLQRWIRMTVFHHCVLLMMLCMKKLWFCCKGNAPMVSGIWHVQTAFHLQEVNALNSKVRYTRLQLYE